MSESGIAVLEADTVGHGLLERHDIYEKVVSCFGPEIVGANRKIDRKLLGRIVFSQHDSLLKLNAVLHPEIRLSWHQWLKRVETEGKSAATVIVPLLYETGYDEEWDYVVCVSAKKSLQIERLKTKGLDGDEIERRLAAQMSLEEKMIKADFVIVNNWQKDMAILQTKCVLKSIMGDAYGNEK